MWKENTKASCTLGILIKFKQHPALSSLLKSTGDKKLAECCNDKDWGTGVPLYKQNALTPSEWHSQGLLGEILETVHNVLNSDSAASATTPISMETAISP